VLVLVLVCVLARVPVPGPLCIPRQSESTLHRAGAFRD
jgi:hypothetical protein